MLHQYVYKKLNGEVPKNHVIDHWGENEDDPIKKKLDNRANNLRAVSRHVNAQNKLVSPNATSKYIGVSKHNNNWRARITHNHICIRIGTFKTQIDAAVAYNKKAIELYGKHAKVNKIPKALLID